MLSALANRPAAATTDADASRAASARNGIRRRIASRRYARFEAAADDLVRVHRYDLNLLNQKITSPAEINFSDNDLSFKPYFLLASACGFGGLRGDASTPPALCATLGPAFDASLARAYAAIARLRAALFDVIFAAITRDESAATRGVETLREYPLELVTWPTDNTGRLDVVLDADAAVTAPRARSAIPRHETAALRWTNDPTALSGGDGLREEDPTFWLLAYWLARARGLVAAES